jgi:hypothetical protein
MLRRLRSRGDDLAPDLRPPLALPLRSALFLWPLPPPVPLPPRRDPPLRCLVNPPRATLRRPKGRHCAAAGPYESSFSKNRAALPRARRVLLRERTADTSTTPRRARVPYRPLRRTRPRVPSRPHRHVSCNASRSRTRPLQSSLVLPEHSRT